MEDAFDIGGESSIAGVTHLVTQWFPVNVSAHEWLFDIHELAGQFARLKLSGGSLGNMDDARVKIELSIRDRYGEAGRKLNVAGISVIDGSLNLATFDIGADLELVDASKVTVYDPDGDGRLRPTVEALDR